LNVKRRGINLDAKTIECYLAKMQVVSGIEHFIGLAQGDLPEILAKL